jgi:hypothetical protein
MGLGRADNHPAVNFGDRFDDLDPAPGQVDPAGGQGHELAPAQAGVGQDSDERAVRRAGLGQRLYLIMSEKALGRGHNAGEGYALGDVPYEPSIADGRCEGQRQDAVGVPDGCRSKSLVGQAVHPARNVRVTMVACWFMARRISRRTQSSAMKRRSMNGGSVQRCPISATSTSLRRTPSSST